MTPQAETPAPRRSAWALYTLLSVTFINILGFGIVVPLLPFYAFCTVLSTATPRLLADRPDLFGLFDGLVLRGAVLGRRSAIGSAASRSWSPPLSPTACATAPSPSPHSIWISAFVIRFLGGMAAGNGSVVQGYIADVTAPEDRAGRMGQPRRRLQHRLHHWGQWPGGFLASLLGRPDRLPGPPAGGLGPGWCLVHEILPLVRESRRLRPVDPELAQPLARRSGSPPAIR